MNITMDTDQAQGQLLDPKLCPEPAKLVIPEFRGKTDEGAFAVRQRLEWSGSNSSDRLKFKLQGDPQRVGLDFQGDLRKDKENILIRAKVRNVTGRQILSGHHTLLLDMTGEPRFHDPTGERTFLYAETGWASLAQLIDPIHSTQHTIRMGATYNGMTVMWKIIARFDEDKKTSSPLPWTRDTPSPGTIPSGRRASWADTAGGPSLPRKPSNSTPGSTCSRGI